MFHYEPIGLKNFQKFFVILFSIHWRFISSPFHSKLYVFRLTFTNSWVCFVVVNQLMLCFHQCRSLCNSQSIVESRISIKLPRRKPENEKEEESEKALMRFTAWVDVGKHNSQTASLMHSLCRIVSPLAHFGQQCLFVGRVCKNHSNMLKVWALR